MPKAHRKLADSLRRETDRHRNRSRSPILPGRLGKLIRRTNRRRLVLNRASSRFFRPVTLCGPSTDHPDQDHSFAGQAAGSACASGRQVQLGSPPWWSPTISPAGRMIGHRKDRVVRGERNRSAGIRFGGSGCSAAAEMGDAGHQRRRVGFARSTAARARCSAAPGRHRRERAARRR